MTKLIELDQLEVYNPWAENHFIWACRKKPGRSKGGLTLLSHHCLETEFDSCKMVSLGFGAAKLNVEIDLGKHTFCNGRVLYDFPSHWCALPTGDLLVFMSLKSAQGKLLKKSLWTPAEIDREFELMRQEAQKIDEAFDGIPLDSQRSIVIKASIAYFSRKSR